MTQLEGSALERVMPASRWYLLNPERPTDALFETLQASPPVTVAWGEFNPGRSRLVWRAMARKFEHVSFEEVTAAGKYLPDWTRLLTDETTHPSDS